MALLLLALYAAMREALAWIGAGAATVNAAS
jgi:hypothetical protein